MLSDNLLQMLRAAFTEEAGRLIINYRETLADLSTATEAQQRRDCVQTFGRLSHMLKGAGRSAECSEIESLSMAMEDKFKALRMESDDPHFDEAAMQTIRDAVSALELLTSSSAMDDDSDPPMSVAEIFGLIDRVENLELCEPETTENAIDPNVRERLRLLSRILSKTLNEKCTGKNISKAYHIAQSLQKEVRSNDLQVLEGVTAKLEALFQQYSQNSKNHQWPILLLTNQALTDYIKAPSDDHESAFEQALVELNNARGAEGSSALHEAFLDETKSSLAALRDVLAQAQANGTFDEKNLKAALSSLTGATQAVNLNASESLCQSLNIVLETVVEFESIPSGLFEHAETAIGLLEADATALVEGTEEPDSDLVLCAIENLDAVTLEEDEPAPEPPPVEASLISPVEAQPAVETSAFEPLEEGLDQDLWSRIHNASQKSTSLGSLVSNLSYRDEAFEELTENLTEWRNAIAWHQGLLRSVSKRKKELKPAELDGLVSFLNLQGDQVQGMEEKLGRWRANASRAQRMTTETVREIQGKIDAIFLTNSQSLLTAINSVIQSVDPDFEVEIECAEMSWDQRVWSDLGLKRSLYLTLKQFWEIAHQAKSTPKLLIQVSVDSRNNLEFALSQKVTAKDIEVDEKRTPHFLKACDVLTEHGGRLQIALDQDKLRATLTVPTAMPKPRAVFFELGTQVFALPSSVVTGVQILSVDRSKSVNVSFRQVDYAVQRLGSREKDRNAVFIEYLDQRVALLVSKILGEEPVAPVALPTSFHHRDFLPYTACFSGDGRPAVFLNPAGTLSLNSTANADESKESKPKLLVAEDFQAARLMFESVLGFAGYDVTTVESGAQALAKLSEAHSDFRAVISDIDMPEMDGFELCREIRKDKNLSSLPFVLVSTLDTEESRQTGTDAGVDFYLSKERFQSEKLLSTLLEIVPLKSMV